MIKILKVKSLIFVKIIIFMFCYMLAFVEDGNHEVNHQLCGVQSIISPGEAAYHLIVLLVCVLPFGF